MRTAQIPLEWHLGRMIVQQLGSPRLTLGLLPVFAIGVIAAGQDAGSPTWVLAAPLLLLAVNLAAAIATRSAFRAQPALLVFHVALLALVVLAAAGRLTYLKGTLELSEGEEFSGKLTQEESGPLHSRSLARAVFTNLEVSVAYEPGLRRTHTRNRVAYRDAQGVSRNGVIGDDAPLKLAGYRFYTTSNKGFAPDFVWRPANGGAIVRGTIHMPSFPAQLARQEVTWSPPGSATVLNTRLEIDERIIDLEGRWQLRPPVDHAIVIESAGVRTILRPGDTREFAEGRLQYTGLRMWMGYSVFHDWTLPWMLASGLLAAASLAWHLALRFRKAPWTAGSGKVRA